MANVILIIDDDAELRKSLKIGLEKDGFAVITAESAEFADAVLKRVAVDGIVLDRMMGGMDGLTFLGNLRAAGDKTPVLMLTAMNGCGNTIDGLAAGADDYLAKPFDLRELSLRLDHMTSRPAAKKPEMPAGMQFIDGEFFVGTKLLALSENEKSMLNDLVGGKIVPMAPMTAKRLRAKLLANVENIDIITVRGKGYKIVRN